MKQAKEIKEKRKELQARKRELQTQIEVGGSRTLQFELAQVEEDIAYCNRELTRLMPRHHISPAKGKVTSNPFALDKDIYRKWFDQEIGSGDNSEDIGLLRQSVRAATLTLSERQKVYFREYLSGDTQEEIGRRYGVARSTVCRALQKAQRDLDKYSHAIAAFRKAGGVDLGDEECLTQFCTLLTAKQQLYISLYYGEWMNCREIEALLGANQSAVYRTIRRGLYALALCTQDFDLDMNIDVESIEDLLIRHFNALEPPEKRAVLNKKWPPESKKAVSPNLQRFYEGVRVRLMDWLKVNGVVSAEGKELWFQRQGHSAGRLRAWLETLKQKAEQLYPAQWKGSLLATLVELFKKIKGKLGRNLHAHDYRNSWARGRRTRLGKSKSPD